MKRQNVKILSGQYFNKLYFLLECVCTIYTDLQYDGGGDCAGSIWEKIYPDIKCSSIRHLIASSLVAGGYVAVTDW